MKANNSFMLILLNTILLIVYYRRHTVYQCGELDKFIETVLGRVESLPVERVAEVLNGFFEQYGCDNFVTCLIL